MGTRLPEKKEKRHATLILLATNMNQPQTLSPPNADKRHFHAHETARMHELEGLPLATFVQRLLGFAVDLIVAVILWAPAEACWRIFVLHENDVKLRWDFHEPGNIVVLILYYGLANYFGNGQTPGKWIARTRAVSLIGLRLSVWQSIERALGYGAAVLECGLGFLQYFWSPNRMCAQDRLAETIVLDLRKRKA